jgi:hypothetical protein
MENGFRILVLLEDDPAVLVNSPRFYTRQNKKGSSSRSFFSQNGRNYAVNPVSGQKLASGRPEMISLADFVGQNKVGDRLKMFISG